MRFVFQIFAGASERDSSVRYFFAHCILSRIERKDLNFFRVVKIFTELDKISLI